MRLSYDRLWKMLIDKKMNKSELAKKAKISSSTLAKMGHEEPVALSVLMKICGVLKCDIGDVISVRK
ncbi:MAG: helix-turn-helix transcriptional regulator [Lachnospiraceae bacterium]|nr:helix-turn-helix transcriptional regulator [Lachnospiraceae bacterium]